MATEVRVPTLGESVTEATVATWFKKPGDSVAADETLAELETDKVSVEVPAPAAGVLGDLVAQEGDTVGVDALLATIEDGAAAGSPAPAGQAADAGQPAPPPAAAPGAADGECVEVRVPGLGESVTEATVATWFKQPGESVAQDEVLAELETDKVSVEVVAPAAGILGAHAAKEGETVGLDALLTTVASGAGAGGRAGAPAGEAGTGGAGEPAPAPPAPAHGMSRTPLPPDARWRRRVSRPGRCRARAATGAS